MDYIEDGRSIGLSGKEISGRRSFVHCDYNEVKKAHFSVLHQVQLATTYIERHIAELRRKNVDKSDEWIDAEHKCSFTS